MTAGFAAPDGVDVRQCIGVTPLDQLRAEEGGGPRHLSRAKGSQIAAAAGKETISPFAARHDEEGAIGAAIHTGPPKQWSRQCFVIGVGADPQDALGRRMVNGSAPRIHLQENE